MEQKNKMEHQNKIEDEFELIKEMTKDFHTYQPILVPNGDDAAIFPVSQQKGQVVCIDTMVEEIHFTTRTMSSFQIGYKALAINLSDIAAMGGTPKYFLVSMAIPPSWNASEIAEIYRGLKFLADECQLDLIGGDTVSAKSALVITVTAIGEVEEHVQLTRSKAKPDDLLFLTGRLGDSAAGLHYLLQSDEKRASFPSMEPFMNLLFAHQQPKPHLQEGRLLARLSAKGAIALNDVSDGLSSEAHEIAERSQVSLVIEQEKLPLSPELKEFAKCVGKNPYEWVFHGGEDFVLIGTLPKELAAQAAEEFSRQNLAFYPIGYAMEGKGEVYLQEKGHRAKLAKQGFNHFVK
ncbi:thiamine-phosphate kinase [Caldalkalibacillus mannanilyticus]|uniref:thiamine-phosphate kinase n=1 Tax=Caldalkalibacillus mannanilyticus TaxID=1418 RepID=UPI0009DD3DA1|nr:thiamine-phosphate kinase [Caldalkalibacillus mannanilyticus]